MNMSAIFLRTVLICFVVFITLRAAGKREKGKLSVFDLVITVIMAEIGVFLIEDANKPLVEGIVPLATLVCIQIAITYLSLKSRTIKKDEEVEKGTQLPETSQFRYEGLPLTLIMDGKVQDVNLAKIDKTRFWLKNQIQTHGAADFKEIFFCTIDHRGRLFIDRNGKNF